MNEFITINEEDLLNTPLEPLTYIVENFISEGLHVLASPPKIGKSWLMLWIGHQVASGGDVWGRATSQGTVLYLCLEDNRSRLQKRLYKIVENPTAKLELVTESDTISTGLLTCINKFLKNHLDTKLIIVDTLQKIRDDTNSANQYANDYSELTTLKKIAYENHIAIILVHHLRKQYDEDPLNRFSGSIGFTSVTDNIYMLETSKRTSQKATLFTTGRDILSMEFKLHFDNNMHLAT